MPSNYYVIPPKCIGNPYMYISKSNEWAVPRCEKSDLIDVKVDGLGSLRRPPKR